MSKKNIITCLNPSYVNNPYTGELMLVSCGCCPACLRAKSAMLTTKCKLESSKHMNKYFITLTYDQENIPLMKAVHVSGKKGHVHKFISCCKRLGEEGQVLAVVPYTHVECNILAEKVNLDGYFGYASKRDIQLFLKRLRKAIHKYYQLGLIKNEKIRYFAVTEYGPSTFRPHIHFILWFDDSSLAQNLYYLVNQSWKLGITDIQAIEHDCASYVAGYVNSTSDLPKVYVQGKCKPALTHSFFLGEEYSKADAEEVYKLHPTEFIKRSFKSDDRVSDYILWRSAQSRFYPKCRAFSTSSTNERKLLYTLAYEFRERKETHRKPYRLALETIAHLINEHKGFPLENFYQEEGRILRQCLQARNYYYDILSSDITDIDATDIELSFKMVEECDKIEQTIKNRIYNDLRVSTQFLYEVCHSHTPLEINTKLQMIENFYSSKELLTLGEQYVAQDTLLRDNNISLADIDYFYDNFIDNDLSNYLESKCYIRYKSKVLSDTSKMKKHKLQNDLNGFWLKRNNL